jgi:CheY-like chemotaxis protein
MQAQCENCEYTFTIPDQKLPQGKLFTVGCPKCKEKAISVDTTGLEPVQVFKNAKPDAPKAAPAREEATGRKQTKEKEENGGESPDPSLGLRMDDAKSALICETDMSVRAAVKDALENLGYHVTVAQNSRGALRQMRFHVFDIIALNEMFETEKAEENAILKTVGRLSMSTRRNMFVALLSERDKTGDNMAAFNKSVNIIINLKNLGDIETVLKKAVMDNDYFYRVYKGLKEKLTMV